MLMFFGFFCEGPITGLLHQLRAFSYFFLTPTPPILTPTPPILTPSPVV